MKIPATPPDPVEATTRAVSALLVSLVRNPTGSAREAFLRAIRRRGQELDDAAGPEALAAVIAKIKDDAPNKSAADARVHVVSLVWKSILGSQDTKA